MSLGVPSKLKGCVPKVDRYTTHLAPVIRGITFKTSAYAHGARDVMSVCRVMRVCVPRMSAGKALVA